MKLLEIKAFSVLHGAGTIIIAGKGIIKASDYLKLSFQANIDSKISYLNNYR